MLVHALWENIQNPSNRSRLNIQTSGSVLRENLVLRAGGGGGIESGAFPGTQCAAKRGSKQTSMTLKNAKSRIIPKEHVSLEGIPPVGWLEGEKKENLN